MLPMCRRLPHTTDLRARTERASQKVSLPTLHILSHGHDPSFAFVLILSEAPHNTRAYQREGLAILKETANTSSIWSSKTLTII